MEAGPLLAAGAGGLFVGVLAHRRFVASVDRSRRARRWRRARRGEARANAVLEAHGLPVLGAQVEGGYEVLVDGRAHPVEVRADRWVKDGRRERLAEVKTGARGVDPLAEPTRRQLLEYAVAFDLPEVLLVDMERRVVHRVRFPLRARPRGGLGLGIALLAGALLGQLPAARDLGHGLLRALGLAP